MRAHCEIADENFCVFLPKRMANRLTTWQSVRAFAESFTAFRIARFNDSFSPELFFFTREETEMGNYIQIRKTF